MIYRLCVESEDIGNNTLGRMQTQRQQLETASSSIERMRQVVMEAKQVMDSNLSVFYYIICKKVFD